MRILVVGSTPSLDDDIRVLQANGHDVAAVANALQAAACLDSESFECILIDVPDSPAQDKSTTLHEMRKLVMTSSVVLTVSTIESLVEKALADGSIALVPDDEIEHVVSSRGSGQPVLLAEPMFNPELLERLTHAGLRAVASDALPSTLNMLADGWCDAVLLKVEIPGLKAADRAALFGPLSPQHMAILASGDYGKPSGIPCVQRPHQPEELLSILEQTVKRRPVPSGWVESLRRRIRFPRRPGESRTKA